MTAPADCTCPPGAHGPVAGCAAHDARHALACDDTRCQRCYPAAMRADAPLPEDEADALRAQLAAAEDERDGARALLALTRECLRGAEDERDDARALLADALRCGLDEAERLREVVAALADEVRAVPLPWPDDATFKLEAHNVSLALERDAALARVATLRGALERASGQLEGAALWAGGPAGCANDTRRLCGEALAADDAATAGG